MADDRNSGMNIPIPFRQIIQSGVYKSKDFVWGGTTSGVNDYHVSARDTYSELPSTVQITLDFGWWADPDYTDVWYNKLIINWEPVDCYDDRGGGGEIQLTSGTIDQVEAADDKYYWKKNVGLYIRSTGGDPAANRDITITVNGDWLKNIYALTHYGLNTEELLNSPNMEIEPGYYALCETISQSSSAIFRTSAMAANYHVRYTLGQSGFWNSFLYNHQITPWQWMVYEKNFFRKYCKPLMTPVFTYESWGSETNVLGNTHWDKNLNFICSAKIKDLESVKYSVYADFATTVWDPRNRAVAFGIEYPIEYVGAVDGAFANNSHIWYMSLMKICGKVQDWKEVHATNNAGVSYADKTADMNLKNNCNLDFDDSFNDWIVVGSDDKFFGFTFKIHSATYANRSPTVEFLSGTGPYAWSAATNTVISGSENPVTNYNSSDYYKMKTVGDFSVFRFYGTWEKQTFEGTEAYWVRIRAGGGTNQKLAWIVNSGATFMNKDYTGTLHRNDATVAWETESVMWTPISMKMIDEKRQLWGCFYDMENKKYHPFAVQFVETDIDDAAKRSWAVERVRVFNGNTLDFSKKFASFAYGSDSYVYAIQVDDKNPDSTTRLVKFSTDITNDSTFTILQDLIGGDGNAAGPIKTNYAQITFPDSELTGEREYGICGITKPNKCIAWEYSNIRNNYINIHKSAEINLSEAIRDIVLLNNSVFYMNHDCQLIFANKNIKGVSEINYELSNHADYGDGNIKRLANFGLYENIINKIKTLWDSEVFGSGSHDIGTGLGIGKQITINNNFIDDKIKALDIASRTFVNYSYIRECIKLEAIFLYFLELTDVVNIKLEHPNIYIDSSKEWLISEITYNVNDLVTEFSLIERLLV